MHNGRSFSISALGDTGADGYVFLSRGLSVLLGKRFGLKAESIGQECPVRGFDGKLSKPITHVTFLTMCVDGRVQQQVPMLIADLGKYDMILGRKWFADHDVLLDCRRYRMIWPDEKTLFDDVSSKMAVPTPTAILQKPKSNPDHQADADRRDRLFGRKELKTKDGYKHTREHQYGHWQVEEQRKMSRSLNDESKTMISKIRRPEETLPTIDISAIGGVGFNRLYKRGKVDKEIETFSTSLYEIDHIIDAKSTPVQDPEISEILRTLPKEYHDLAEVFSKKKSDELPPYRPGVDHDIVLEAEAQPGYCPLYKLSIDELKAAREYILNNLQKGFIVPSSAPYASPILMAKKPGGGLRFCVDFRKLNAITKKDCYPLPLIDEVLQRTSKAKFFTKLDIQQGFHRIRLTPGAEDLTTFRTRYGSFKYKVTPFGLTNGPATFQRFMNDVLRECLDEYAVAFVDDILIYSETLEDHQRQVREVLSRLQKAGLQVALPKCEFSVQRTKFLGFIVSTDGIAVDPGKISVVQSWKAPSTVKGIQSFLGFCNFYRRFIQGYSAISKPLHRLTRQDVSFEWSERCEAAFLLLKRKLMTTPVLRHYDPVRRTRVETDASDGVLGAVLSQYYENDDFWHPVAFFSKTMQPAELNYEIRDKELLAIVRALQEWRPELEGLSRKDRFEILKDHQSLEYFMTTRQMNQRQARWSEFLSQFHFVIKYRPGKKNIVADVLSRKDSPCTDNGRQFTLLPKDCLEEGVYPVDLNPIDVEQSENVIERVKQANRQSTELEEFRQIAEGGSDPRWTLYEGLLLFDERLEVPDEGDLRARLLDDIHRQPLTAHPGIEKLKKLVSSRYHWPGWATDVRRYVENCLVCKRTKAWRDRTPGLLHPLPIPERPWQHISMDFRSFPKDRHGYDTVFVVVDRLSKRPISIPCQKDTNAKQMARMFINNVIRVTGIPETIVSDRGGQFVSEFWTEFCRILGIRRKLSTAYHPQTDGQSEIANQYMAQRLRPYVEQNQDNWSEILPMVDFAASILPQDTTKQSPFFIERGYEPAMSFDWRDRGDLTDNEQDAASMLLQLQDIWKKTKDQIAKSQQQQIQQANKHRREEDFDVGDYVFVTTKDWQLDRPNRKLSHLASGPYKIVQKIGNAYKLDLPESIKVHPVFNPSKLRKATAMEPLRGQHVDPPPPVVISEEDEWEVDKILDSRLHYRKLQYRVQWLGHDLDLQWYPAGNFKHAPQKIQDFHDQYPVKPGPPARLQTWVNAAKDEVFLEDHDDDDKPAFRD
ncbi:RNA-directed DNA polymerase (reverse transcriptase) [Penicillium camemberti]|uniref:RNA-directed DNA polymerase (Reverse transcriptase) n=1 Tax=Penicillium camemberti (strain FM 013) TaxID=1429867 RepID=A0A0G4PYA1_PENC3|nr:RNA-directed DNA polymerase (reverse transcriptase) [Penicillium camemberti]